MAIRIALGGAPTAVIALVLRRVALLVGVGLLAGTGISAWAEKFVGGLLYGLPPRDPTTVVGAVVLLAVTGALAVWFPARKATRTDPLEALRES
jgi:ABC-type antimicrobial peptide transport system permease subunit